MHSHHFSQVLLGLFEKDCYLLHANLDFIAKELWSTGLLALLFA